MATGSVNVTSATFGTQFTVKYSLEKYNDYDYPWVHVNLGAYNSSGSTIGSAYIKDLTTESSAFSGSVTSSISKTEFDKAVADISGGSGAASYRLIIGIANWMVTDYVDPDITVPFYPYTACTAPTSVSASPTSVVPGGSSTLKWSGAKSGTNNSISGYQIWRSTNASSGYANVSSLAVTGLNISGTDSTARTKSVPASSTNGQTYYYKVVAVGATGSSYNSAVSSNYGTVKAEVSKCVAPTSVSLGATTSTGGNVTLSWSGANVGTNNSITGYDIYYREYDNSTGKWGNWASYTSVTSTDNKGSTSVPAPAALSNSYQYEVRTKGGAGSSWYSDFAASSNSVKRVCTLTTPSDFKIASTTSNTAALSWTKSTLTGASGTITYSLRKGGTQFATTTDTSYTVQESVTKDRGTDAVSLTVVATYSGYSSAASSAVSYTYSTSISAATNVSVSPTSGQSATLTWTKGSRGDGGTVTSSVVINNTVVASELTGTSYAISESIAAQYGPTLTIKVRTVGASKSADSASVTFTYIAPHKYVARWTGSAWQKCIVYYWTGSAWQEAVVKRWSGSAWQDINNT